MLKGRTQFISYQGGNSFELTPKPKAPCVLSTQFINERPPRRRILGGGKTYVDITPKKESKAFSPLRIIDQSLPAGMRSTLKNKGMTTLGAHAIDSRRGKDQKF